MISLITRVIFIAVLFTASKFCYAQPEYYEAQRARQQANANNAARDKQNAINNRPFESKWGSATGVFGSVMNSSQPSSEYLARMQAVREKTAKDIRDRKTVVDAYRIAYAPYQQYFEQIPGVTPSCSWELAFQTIDPYNEFKPRPNNESIYYLPFYHEQYLAKAKTGSYEEVLGSLGKLRPLTGIAVQGLQELSKRFPEKQAQSDIAMIYLLVGKYGTKDLPPCNRCNERERMMMENLFFELARKYPDIMGVALDAEYSNGNGYTSDINWMSTQGKKAYKEMLKLEEEYFGIPTKNLEGRLYTCREFLFTKDLAFLKKLADTCNMTTFSLLMKLTMLPNEKLNNGRQGYYTYYYPSAKDELEEEVAKLVELMAKDGSPEAMNLYGLRIAQGWTDEPKGAALTWLQKAADAGAPYAKKNLEDICLWKIKDLKDYCKGKN